MKYSPTRRTVALASVVSAAFALSLFAPGRAPAQPAPVPNAAAGGPKILFDPRASGADKLIAPNTGSEADVTTALTPEGIDITVAPNGKSSFPGIIVTPAVPWDASGYGHVEVRATNNGTKPIRVNLLLTNPGKWPDAHQNTEIKTVKPGESQTVATIFGYNYGKAGSTFDPAAIVSATIFIGKSDVEQRFHVEALTAAGPAGEKPYVDPRTVAVKPAGGVILGPDTALDPKQFALQGGAKAAVAPGGKGWQVSFVGGKEESVLFKPVSGLWNLNEHLQVRVQLKNTGNAPVTPSVRLESNGGPSDAVAAKSAVAPGGTAEIVVPFAAAVPWKIAGDPTEETTLELKKTWEKAVPGTGTLYKSNVTTGITILSDKTPGAKTLEVTGIVADMPPLNLPAWLGQKPPVDGDWTKTFDDNFDGNTIDLTKWNIYTENEWHLGANTHYSKDGLIVKDGKLFMRVEKKRGHHNDNPAYAQNDYQTGYADTFGKWIQRYGYFEARVKLSKAPNMFPAFWMMPDRGAATVKTTHQRNDTKEGGMEFDIMETLSIWGPYRHDAGMHWDGYMKYHKSNGMFTAYAQPDKDGFITAGMLWLPGLIVMYDNGKETSRWESPRVASVPESFILTALTGGWEAEPMDDAQLPADIVFDYIRAWQRKDLAEPGDGPQKNDGGPLAPGVTQAPPDTAKK